jgi:hypothetical protein
MLGYWNEYNINFQLTLYTFKCVQLLSHMFEMTILWLPAHCQAEINVFHFHSYARSSVYALYYLLSGLWLVVCTPHRKKSDCFWSGDSSGHTTSYPTFSIIFVQICTLTPPKWDGTPAYHTHICSSRCMRDILQQSSKVQAWTLGSLNQCFPQFYA